MYANERCEIYDKTQGHCGLCGKKMLFTEKWNVTAGLGAPYQITAKLPLCEGCLRTFYSYSGDLNSVRRALKEKQLYQIREHTTDLLVALCPVFTYQPFHNTDELQQCLENLNYAIDDAGFIFYYEKLDKESECSPSE